MYLDKEQYGFRRNHSTLNTLETIHTDICSAFRRNQHLILIALDIKKAYDMNWRERVLTILQNWDINGNLLTFTRNFLTNRSFNVKINNQLSTTHNIVNRLPQGSVLSITLFLVAINDICKNLPKPVKYTLFADDCNIYCSGSQIKSTTQFLQRALDSLSKWSSKTGFFFSTSKKQCIIFNKNKNKQQPVIKFMNTQLIFLSNIRILGLIFNDKLSWQPHLKKLKTECLTRMRTVKILGNYTWGAETKTLISIYKALILFLIDYGSIIYNSAKPKTLKSLDPIHNQGIRLATGAFRTSPIESIMCNAGELPLYLRRQSDILKYITKIKGSSNHIINNIFHNTLSANQICNRRTILENFKILSENLHLQDQKLSKATSPLPPWLWSAKINTQLSEFSKHNTPSKTIQNIFLEIIFQQYPRHTQIYTDASKNINGTGFAVITENENYVFSLPHSTCIYTAETYAIYEAVKIGLSSTLDNTIIISDSFSAITSITNPYPENELVHLIQRMLSTTNKAFSFMWVPSHVGISGDERSDSKANEATISQFSTKIIKITTSDAIKNIKKKIIDVWQNNWNKVSCSNKLRNIKPHVNQWKNPLGISRREEVVITRARIGHIHLNHSYLISK